jgi:hypothetical protein
VVLKLPRRDPLFEEQVKLFVSPPAGLRYAEVAPYAANKGDTTKDETELIITTGRRQNRASHGSVQRQRSTFPRRLASSALIKYGTATKQIQVSEPRSQIRQES